MIITKQLTFYRAENPVVLDHLDIIGTFEAGSNLPALLTPHSQYGPSLTRQRPTGPTSKVMDSWVGALMSPPPGPGPGPSRSPVARPPACRGCRS